MEGVIETHVLCLSSAISAPSLDEWISAPSQTVARRQDITLADPLEHVKEGDELSGRDGFGMEDSFGGGDWQAFDLEGSLEKDGEEEEREPPSKLDTSTVSDIETGREAETSLLRAPLDDSSLVGVHADDKSVISGDGKDEEQPDQMEQPDFGFDHAYEDLPVEPMDMDMNMSLNVEEPVDKSLDISTDLNLTLNGNDASRASIDFALMNEEEENASQAVSRQKKRRKIGRDSVTELSSAVLKKGMTDVSDIVRQREITCKHTKDGRAGAINLEYTSVADLFSRPCMEDLADELLTMFKYTMKKRKFPFEAAESHKKKATENKEEGSEQNDEEEIERTRRESELPVRTILT